MAGTQPVPLIRQVVLDTTDARGLAEFYRELRVYADLAGHPFCIFGSGSANQDGSPLASFRKRRLPPTSP